MTLPLSEAGFQTLLVEALRLHGYRTNHVRRAVGKGKRWTTPTSAVGWPDLTALRGPHLLAIEVKSDTGKATPEQVEWLERFALLPCARAWILRPADPWDVVMAWMQRPEGAPQTFGWPSQRG